MVQREKSRDSVLFLMALAPCLCLAQTSNNGVFCVKPGTVLSTISSFNNNQGAEFVNDGELFVYDDFKNDGKVGFTSGVKSGLTRLYGQKTVAQALSGAGTSEVYNVEFNNVPGFAITNALAVSGNADFRNGVVATEGLLTFEKDATVDMSNDASFVKGTVVKKGNNAFTFPVGSGSMVRPVSITAPTEQGAVFTGKYVFENPNGLYPVNKLDPSLKMVNDAEYWEIKRTDAGTSNVVVTLTWDAATTPAAIFAGPETEIVVVRWDAAKNLWINEGGVVDSAKKQVITVASSLGDYGVFTLARSIPGVDPVDPVVPGDKAVAVAAGLSPDGDGINDELVIAGLEAHPDNKLTVFDRVGKVVFETTAYNTKGNVFKGFMNEGGNKVLPLGTYFYTVDYLDEATGRRVKKTNYLYINLR
jgi:gliding motility-associated-like protein